MTENTASNMPFIELSFAPDLNLIPRVREFATHFYREVFGDDDALSSLAVVTHELLENAVKHSTDGVTKIRIEYQPKTQKVTIRTFNCPVPANLASLQRVINEANAAPDVNAHFQRVLRESVQRKEGSGLGLMRVICEGGFALRLQLEGPRVWVIAERQIAALPYSLPS